MSSKMFPHLFSPAKIGGLELKNRIMKAPQSSGMSNMDGTVSERLVRYYRKQAAGGSAMIIVEYAYVDDIPGNTADLRAFGHSVAKAVGSVRRAVRASRTDH